MKTEERKEQGAGGGTVSAGTFETGRAESVTEADLLAKSRATFLHTFVMNGSYFSVITYGIVEYLRVRPKIRAVVAGLGVIFALFGIACFLGFQPLTKTMPYSIFAMLSIFCLWVATVSGPNFQFRYPEAKALQEQNKAEEKFAQTHTLQDALTVDLTRLNVYYEINQAQARSSFWWAIASMIVGMGTIISGIWIFYFRGSQPDTFMASLSTAAGIVVNLISGLFLLLYNKTQDRSILYYKNLSRLQQLSIAIRLVDVIEDVSLRNTARDRVITELLAAPNLKDQK